MNQTLLTRITRHLSDAGYDAAAISGGIAFAEAAGYTDDDEALSLVATKILYSEDQIADGARFAVEAGSW